MTMAIVMRASLKNFYRPLIINMDLNNRVLVVAIYSHPEYYPPTLSALENLALLYKKIYVLHGNTKGFDWKYPDNVILVGSGTQYEPAEVEAASVRRKIRWFI